MPSSAKKGHKAVPKRPVPDRTVLTPPVIDPEKCTRCGLCTDVCVTFEKRGEEVVVAIPEFCIHCGSCGATCPSGAISNTSAEPKKITKQDQALLPSPESLQFLFRSRRSVRVLKDKPISSADMNKILEACRYTPTGLNAQDINYIIINSPEKIAELREMTMPAVERLFGMAERIASIPFLGRRLMGDTFVENVKTLFAPGIRNDFEHTRRGHDRLFFHAPAIMLVHGEKSDDMAFSCSAALFNGSMLAHTLGIGCCLNGFLSLAANQDKPIKNWLGIPKRHKCYAAMTLGYQGVKYNTLVRRNPPKVRWLG
jgi:nitroreductase/NAD-dependent dihydropyrimidine dehydrogenase PreA subunit